MSVYHLRLEQDFLWWLEEEPQVPKGDDWLDNWDQVK